VILSRLGWDRLGGRFWFDSCVDPPLGYAGYDRWGGQHDPHDAAGHV
jgi:hypothetical protein